ncbi:MAG: flippase [Gemmatimonadetes bacterium]|nr:flippase [Gemmatimonadota bacterium]
MLNLTGQAAPFLIGLLAMPAIVRGLGTARFGLLGLCWVVVGYFSVLDLGLGRAATRFAADAVGRKATAEIPGIIWSAVVVQLLAGTIGAVAVAALAPPVTHLLHVPPELQSEAQSTFRVLALALPLVLIGVSFRGVLEASQRFDLVNLVSIPGSALNFLIPLGGALAGWSLPDIMLVLVLGRGVTTLAYFLLAARLFPGLTRPLGTRLSALRALLSFGAWITVSNVLSPLVDQLDRLLLGTFAGVDSVGFYTAPQEAVLRTRILPNALAATLFPEFTAQAAAGAAERTRRYYAIAIRSLAFLLGPVTLVLVLLGPDILALWLGADFARASGTALRLLAVGAFANALAFVPFAYLHAANRPDLPAKFHIAELPGFLLLAWLLMPRFTVSGAGAAWAVRATADAALLFAAARRLGAAGTVRWSAGTLVWAGLIGGGLLMGFLPAWARLEVAPRLLVAAAGMVLLLGTGWLILLQPQDRDRIRATLRR